MPCFQVRAVVSGRVGSVMMNGDVDGFVGKFFVGKVWFGLVNVSKISFHSVSFFCELQHI